MAVVILVLGGVVSAVSAFTAWLLGANATAILAVYALSGLIFSGALLYRLYPRSSALDAILQQRIDLEMLALREQLGRDHAAAGRKAARASIFALLRNGKRR